MYALKVKLGNSITVEDEIKEGASQLADAILSDRKVCQGDDLEGYVAEEDALNFSAGNPRVEHITGIIHLYRNISKSKQVANADRTVPALPEGRNERLCVLAIPADMGVADFCQFVGGYLPLIRHMRVVRREQGKCVYSVLMRFDSLATAESFYNDFNGKPYSPLEPEVICRLVWVKQVDYLSGQSAEDRSGGATQPISTQPSRSGSRASTPLGTPVARSDYLAPPEGQVELPSCPVCLERLDEHISGVVTTVCNHRFHNECLQRWGDTSCPVCRYVQHPGTTSHCTHCGTSQDVWICLICGHIGCGRYKSAHAVDHWKDSNHCYALELETQRVWDYVGDGYVHRLIQSKTDGKLVAVPSPATGSRGPRGSRGPACDPRQGDDAGTSCCPSEAGSDFEEALIASKLDGIAQEYNHLLVTQLESQRQYYEGVVLKSISSSEQRLMEARADRDKAASLAQQAQAEARRELQLRKAAERKMVEVQEKVAKQQQEQEFLRQLNQTLLANQKDFKSQLEAERSARLHAESTAQQRVKELEEQVRDLMVYIEMQQKLEQEGAEVVKDGTIVGVAEAPAKGKSVRRKGSRK